MFAWLDDDVPGDILVKAEVVEHVLDRDPRPVLLRLALVPIEPEWAAQGEGIAASKIGVVCNSNDSVCTESLLIALGLGFRIFEVRIAHMI